MNDKLLSLPPVIIDEIFNILWGSVSDFKTILQKSLKILPDSWILHLRDTKKMTIRGKIYTELDDNMYCPKCGEKFLFPFIRDICWDCNEYQTLGLSNPTFLLN